MQLSTGDVRVRTGQAEQDLVLTGSAEGLRFEKP